MSYNVHLQQNKTLFLFNYETLFPGLSVNVCFIPTHNWCLGGRGAAGEHLCVGWADMKHEMREGVVAKISNGEHFFHFFQRHAIKCISEFIIITKKFRGEGRLHPRTR